MRTQKYKVSIILPVYNVEKYIEECIKSLINQTYKNIEILFVNDGSTDDSEKIINKYIKIDSRIKKINKKNGGVSSAKNLGIRKAIGEYITFVDPDDFVSEDYIEYLVELIRKNNSDIAISKYNFDNYNLNQIRNDNFSIYTPTKGLKEILKYNINVAVWNKMYKTSFIKKNNISFYEDIYMGEGFNFNIIAFKNSNNIAVGLKKIYFYRRDNNNSATTKFKIEKWENALKAIEKIRENLTNYDDIKDYVEFAKWRTSVDAYSLLKLSKQEKKYKKFEKNMKKNARKKFILPFILNCSLNDKIRAVLIITIPSLLPFLMKIRRKISNVNIKN